MGVSLAQHGMKIFNQTYTDFKDVNTINQKQNAAISFIFSLKLTYESEGMVEI